MKKVSIQGSNAFCPQPLYLYGTYREDGHPNFGLFCWCTYCATDKQKFVACIGEDKLTRDLIRKTGCFSASIVSETFLQNADWCGTHSGYEYDKYDRIESERGKVLNVPIPLNSVWTLELKVQNILKPDEAYDSDIYICSIENVCADERLINRNISFEEKLKIVQPIVTMDCNYIPVDCKTLGKWGNILRE